METAALLQRDIDRVVRALPAPLRGMLSGRGDGLILAGGFVRDTIARLSPRDIDIWPTAVTDAPKVLASLFACDAHVMSTSDMSHCKCEGHTVQLIHGYGPMSVVARLESFDFTVCRAAIWYANRGWKGLCDAEFYPDVACRRLRYTNPPGANTYPVASVRRAFSFVSRGWFMPTDSLRDLLASVVKGRRGLGNDEAANSIAAELHADYLDTPC